MTGASKWPIRFRSVGDPLVRNAVAAFVRENGYITNRRARDLLDIGYDEAIFLLNYLCEVGVLRREGITSGTRYVLIESVEDD